MFRVWWFGVEQEKEHVPIFVNPNTGSHGLATDKNQTVHVSELVIKYDTILLHELETMILIKHFLAITIPEDKRLSLEPLMHNKRSL